MGACGELMSRRICSPDHFAWGLGKLPDPKDNECCHAESCWKMSPPSLHVSIVFHSCISVESPSQSLHIRRHNFPSTRVMYLLRITVHHHEVPGCTRSDLEFSQKLRGRPTSNHSPAKPILFYMSLKSSTARITSVDQRDFVESAR